MPKVKTDTGIACSHCGCHNTRIIRTTPERGYVLRRHQCRQCGKRVTTVERIIGRDAPKIPDIDDGVIRLSIGQIRDSLDIIEGRSGQRT